MEDVDALQDEGNNHNNKQKMAGSSKTCGEKTGANEGSVNKARDIITAPDGGWGWMIVVAAFISNFIIDGVIGCFGLLFPDLLEQFSASSALTSMAGSMIVGVYMCSSLFVGGLIRRFGCRCVSIVGGCVGATGCVLSLFSQSLHTFMLMYGVIGGIGFGMNSLPAHIVINTYFNEKRGFANGIAMAGAGVGVFVLAPLIQFTLTEYGWRGTMLLCGAVVLHFCVCGSLMRPLNSPTSSKQRRKEDKILNKNEDKPLLQTLNKQDIDNSNSITGKNITSQKRVDPQRPSGFLTPDLQRKPTKEPLFSCKLMSDRHRFDSNSLPDLKALHLINTADNHLRTRHNAHHILYDPFKRKDILYSGSLYHLKEFKENTSMEAFIESMTICDKDNEHHDEEDVYSVRSSSKTIKQALRHICDLTVFRNKIFIPVLIGAIGIQMSQFIPNTYIAAYCYTIGLKGDQVSMIVAIFGAFNILGRVSAGCLANMTFVSTLWLFNFGVFMCGVACIVFPLCTTFLSVSAFAAALGYFMGYFPPLQVLVLVEYIGIEKLTSSLGFVQLAKGFSAIAGPPLAGVVYEWTNSYGMAVQFAGILSFIAAFAQSLVPVLDRFLNRNKRKRDLEMIET